MWQCVVEEREDRQHDIAALNQHVSAYLGFDAGIQVHRVVSLEGGGDLEQGTGQRRANRRHQHVAQ
jgi:hypothetical protein